MYNVGNQAARGIHPQAAVGPVNTALLGTGVLVSGSSPDMVDTSFSEKDLVLGA